MSLPALASPPPVCIITCAGAALSSAAAPVGVGGGTGMLCKALGRAVPSTNKIMQEN